MSEDQPIEPSPFATSRVVTAVFDDILAAVQDGRLLPGQRISDAVLAEQLGVSRTPVREALQRLREIGIVEASPSRFTRIAEVTPTQTAQALQVWLALFPMVIDEVLPTANESLVAAMTADHERFRECIAADDMEGTATANLSFFNHLTAASFNPILQRAITSVVHIIRLGSLHLPEHIEFEALDRAHELLIAATADQDVAAGRSALELVAAIKIPQDNGAESP